MPCRGRTNLTSSAAERHKFVRRKFVSWLPWRLQKLVHDLYQIARGLHPQASTASRQNAAYFSWYHYICTVNWRCQAAFVSSDGTADQDAAVHRTFIVRHWRSYQPADDARVLWPVWSAWGGACVTFKLQQSIYRTYNVDDERRHQLGSL